MFREIRKWSIRTTKEFDGLVTMNTSYMLFKDEEQRVIELDITELRKLKEFFDGWIDPYRIDNPEHSDKLK